MKIMPLTSPTGRVKLQAYRHKGGYYNEDGFWVTGGYEPFTVTANVQPALRWNQQQQLPEGDRGKKSILILSYKGLEVADDRVDPQGDPQVKTKADIVKWKNQLWEIKTSDPYEMGVLDHWECIAVRVDDDTQFKIIDDPTGGG